MGWNGGTEIFDCVVGNLLELEIISETPFNQIVHNLYRELCNQDWDNFCESEYYMHPLVMEALGKQEDYEDWLEEQQDNA